MDLVVVPYQPGQTSRERETEREEERWCRSRLPHRLDVSLSVRLVLGGQYLCSANVLLLWPCSRVKASANGRLQASTRTKFRT